MGFVIYFESIKLAKSLGEPNRTNTKAIIPVSSRGAKKIPSLCSEQAVRSHKIICHCEERSDEAISAFFPKKLPRFARNDTNRMRLPRFARNGGLPRSFRACNDIVKYILSLY